MPLSLYDEKRSASRVVGIAIVVLLHVAVIYALVTVLGRHPVKLVRPPIQVKIIDEPQQAKVEPPPPPPLLRPPPLPNIPLPEVRIQQAVKNNPPISPVVHDTPAPAPPPPMVPAPAPVPAPHQPIVVAAVIDPTNGCRGKPDYPEISRRLGEQGTVTLRFLIGVDGRVKQSQIVTSSGHPRLDEAARTGLGSLCRFKPGTVDGKPEETWAEIRYAWKLN